MYGIAASEIESLTGKRFLVVDDELVNVQFFVNFFEDLELAVDVAYDGQEAIDLIFSHSPDYYAAVLMDVRMPHLNGTSATKAIKQRHEWAVLPIIAMSGNYQHQDLDDYLKSGMVDLLPKPASLRSIIDTLLKWTQPPNEPSPAQEPVSEPKNAQHKALEDSPLTEVDIAQRLQETGISHAGYKRLLQAFLLSQKEALQTLQQAITEHNTPRAADAAHKLAGACGNIGANTLRALSKQLQDQCESRVSEHDIHITMRSIETRLSLLCREIEQFCHA